MLTVTRYQCEYCYQVFKTEQETSTHEEICQMRGELGKLFAGEWAPNETLDEFQNWDKKDQMEVCRRLYRYIQDKIEAEV